MHFLWWVGGGGGGGGGGRGGRAIGGSGGGNSIKIVLPSSVDHSKRKEITFVFPFRVDPFSEGLVLKVANWKSQKGVSLAQNSGRKLPSVHVCSSLKMGRPVTCIIITIAIS